MNLLGICHLLPLNLHFPTPGVSQCICAYTSAPPRSLCSLVKTKQACRISCLQRSRRTPLMCVSAIAMLLTRRRSSAPSLGSRGRFTIERSCAVGLTRFDSDLLAKIHGRTYLCTGQYPSSGLALHQFNRVYTSNSRCAKGWDL